MVSKAFIIIKITKQYKIVKFDGELNKITLQNERAKKERVRFSKVLLKERKV